MEASPRLLIASLFILGAALGGLSLAAERLLAQAGSAADSHPATFVSDPAEARFGPHRVAVPLDEVARLQQAPLPQAGGGRQPGATAGREAFRPTERIAADQAVAFPADI